jgi:phosphoenolpyruvate carboxylase
LLSQLVKDEAMRNAISLCLKAEWQALIDPLNHLQIELLQRHRSGESKEKLAQSLRGKKFCAARN